jgi:hypothetical protein
VKFIDFIASDLSEKAKSSDFIGSDLSEDGK